MKIKVAIVDDNEILRGQISDIVKTGLREKVLLCGYSKAENLLEDMESGFDIYILDIEMPGMNGLELAQKIRQKDRNNYIIFVTSYDRYAIQGYRTRAYAYVLKEEMEHVLPDLLKELERILHDREQQFYLIETSTNLIKLLYDDILYIYKEEKNSVFVTENGEEHQRLSLEKVYHNISSDEFVYADKGRIVNVHNVKKVVKDKLYMTNGDEIMISRSNMKKVKLAVKAYWKKQM